MEFKYKYDELFNPTLTALHDLGGSGSIAEIEEKVATILNLTDEEANDLHRGNTSKLSYRLAWARNYLKRYGLLENSARGVWSLTEIGLRTTSIDKNKVKRAVKSDSKINSFIENQSNTIDDFSETETDDNNLEKLTWQEEIINELQNISPNAFERLCQRLLRELGFQNVEVTGQTNDGGIDGKGVLRLGGILSFNVIFQAKRYKGVVSASVVRDFRGAMVGRADKGVIITTGSFTREAKKEAIRDGTPPIDLMDGNDLAEKLKELRLGIKVEMVEMVNVDQSWFQSI